MARELMRRVVKRCRWDLEVGCLYRHQCSTTLEEIGWTPIRLRRWLRVKRRIHRIL